MSVDNRPLPFHYQFISGAVAGISELLIMYPLDVVKTRIQLQVGSGANAEYSGVLDCLTKIVRTEGAGTLYRGITAPILMEAPKRATKFAANDEWGKVWKKAFGVENLNQSLAILNGACAGATEAFIVVPFELVKIRLQDKTKASLYSGPGDCLVKTVKQEGLLSLYKGLESTLWRQSIWNAGYFGVIYQVRALMPVANDSTQKTINDLVSGMIGGIFGTTLNTPFDVVKSRIQSVAPGQAAKYTWAWPSLGVVLKEEGFFALYKGYLPKVLRLGPGGGIMLVVFTNCMDFFRGVYYADEPKPLN
ncbi:mitochondrial 2-oxodicarboxylate carrier [Martiniozyma asiatica (nom. inval.)]|nr:mitochondrial 2-oxodicarboxylate carrier [Martiniozyma asiatica]